MPSRVPKNLSYQDCVKEGGYQEYELKGNPIAIILLYFKIIKSNSLLDITLNTSQGNKNFAQTVQRTI